MVRSFKLTNRRGQSLSLNDPKHFGNTPQGLGVEFSSEYYQYGGYFKNIKRNPVQSQIQFNMIFGADNQKHAYEKMRDFTTFLNGGGLKLIYTTDAFEVEATVEVNSLTKSELTSSGILSESLVLTRTSPWYKQVGFTVGERVNTFTGGKVYGVKSTKPVYGFIYGDYYGTQFDLGTSSEQRFKVYNSFLNEQNEGVGIELTITSNVDGYTDPIVSLYNEDLNILQTEGFNVVLNKGDQLKVISYTGEILSAIKRVGYTTWTVFGDNQMVNVTGYMRLYDGMNVIRNHKVPKGSNNKDLTIQMSYRQEYLVV